MIASESSASSDVRPRVDRENIYYLIYICKESYILITRVGRGKISEETEDSETESHKGGKFISKNRNIG